MNRFVKTMLLAVAVAGLLTTGQGCRSEDDGAAGVPGESAESAAQTPKPAEAAVVTDESAWSDAGWQTDEALEKVGEAAAKAQKTAVEAGEKAVAAGQQAVESAKAAAETAKTKTIEAGEAIKRGYDREMDRTETGASAATAESATSGEAAADE